MVNKTILAVFTSRQNRHKTLPKAHTDRRLHPALFGFTPPSLGHLQGGPLAPLTVLPLHLLFSDIVVVVLLLELGLDLSRVHVRVEVSHDREDQAHSDQEGGEEDVLRPLGGTRAQRKRYYGDC